MAPVDSWTDLSQFSPWEQARANNSKSVENAHRTDLFYNQTSLADILQRKKFQMEEKK